MIYEPRPLVNVNGAVPDTGFDFLHVELRDSKGKRKKKKSGGGRALAIAVDMREGYT